MAVTGVRRVHLAYEDGRVPEMATAERRAAGPAAAVPPLGCVGRSVRGWQSAGMALWLVVGGSAVSLGAWLVLYTVTWVCEGDQYCRRVVAGDCVNGGRSWRRDLLLGISVSLLGGVILAASDKVLALARPTLSARGVPVWLFAAVAGPLVLVAVVLARRLGRGAPQAFIVISAFVQTTWLAGLLNNITWSLDRHGIDLVVKLPTPDYGGQSLIQQLARLRKHRRSYIGGLVVATQPEAVRTELTEFCESARLPVVFVDVRPFPAGHRYPPGTAFAGCDATEIGERAADWVASEMLRRHRPDPAILVVCGDTQHDRQARFAARIRDLLPSAVLSLSQPGQFSRERAREIVGHHLRRGDRLDAAFCTNDQMALGAADAIREHAATGHAREDPVVIGVDGIEEAIAVIKSGTTPLKATIVQEPQHLADAAVNLLLRLRAGEQVPAETQIPTTTCATS